jgi:DNA repair protein RadC
MRSTTTYALRDTDLVLTHGDRPYVLRVNDLPIEEKPREKLIEQGPQALSIAELLTVIFTVGTKHEDVLAMSQRVLKEYGEKAIAEQKDPTKLQAELDIPIVKACQLVASFELGRRLFAPNELRTPVFLRTPQQVYDHLKDMRDLPKEQLRGLYLNTHYGVVHEEVISIGSLSANIIHPREVFSPALAYGASAVILAHNHPSGVATPSDADTKVTEQLVAAGKILGVTLLDHIIVTAQSFASIPVSYD